MIVLDSDILILLFRKDRKTLEQLVRLDAPPGTLATTSLNVAEVLRGREPGVAAAMAEAILQGIPELPFGPRAARRYGQLMHALDRAGRAVPAVDGMIAAICLEEGASIFSRNRRDFERVPGLDLAAA